MTVTALIALYRSDQLGFRLKPGMDNGLTKEELSEAATHLAFCLQTWL
ncbi:hypothetical protein LIU39_15620 [Streptomyces sp. SF28]|nr:hypothetical protein [Streptomyces pinistramenti]MCB5908802.1 hypothetical protein [Streptomyces pinistramenti]